MSGPPWLRAVSALRVTTRAAMWQSDLLPLTRTTRFKVLSIPSSSWRIGDRYCVGGPGKKVGQPVVALGCDRVRSIRKNEWQCPVSHGGPTHGLIRRAVIKPDKSNLDGCLSSQDDVGLSAGRAVGGHEADR